MIEKNPSEKTINVLKNFFRYLTPKEKRVLKLRFGLKSNRSKTLEEVAQRFGVTRERIRQIEAKGLEKLRQLYYGKN